MEDLAELELQILEIDDRLRPIGSRQIDINQPNWEEILATSQDPASEAGVGPELGLVLAQLIEKYQEGEEGARRKIRQFFAAYANFGWAAALAGPPTNAEEFRKHVILFSMKDQGRDSRDALLSLQALCAEARAAGVSTTAILREVARMSSDENKYGMGSTRRMLEEAW